MPGKKPTGRPSGRPKVESQLPDLVTTADLAKLIGVTAPYITKLVHDGVLPREKHGWYRTVECVHAFIAYKVEITARANQSTSADKLRDERAQEIRIKTAARERELIPLADAVADSEEMAGLYLTSISGLPARITRNPRERQRIEAICDEERLRLSDRFAKQAQILETGISDPQAFAEDDAGPVGAEKPRLPADGRRSRSAKT